MTDPTEAAQEQTMLERLAWAIKDAVEATAYVGIDIDLTGVSVDGEVNFVSCAKAALEALLEPTPEMETRWVQMKTPDGLEIFTAMIRFALSNHPLAPRHDGLNADNLNI